MSSHTHELRIPKGNEYAIRYKTNGDVVIEVKHDKRARVSSPKWISVKEIEKQKKQEESEEREFQEEQERYHQYFGWVIVTVTSLGRAAGGKGRTPSVNINDIMAVAERLDNVKEVVEISKSPHKFAIHYQSIESGDQDPEFAKELAADLDGAIVKGWTMSATPGPKYKK